MIKMPSEGGGGFRNFFEGDVHLTNLLEHCAYDFVTKCDIGVGVKAKKIGLVT
jgi:hypothetical protein